jgi:hypothetical protein
MEYDEKQKLEKNILDALKILYEVDKYLISHRVSERNIVGRFYLYFNESIQLNFKGYNVDSEYNRNMEEPKRLPHFEKGTFPDIIVHKRGSNEDNLLIIEFKTWWNSNNSKDVLKIQGFMNPNGVYKYKYGLSIVLGKNEPILQWID